MRAFVLRGSTVRGVAGGMGGGRANLTAGKRDGKCLRSGVATKWQRGTELSVPRSDTTRGSKRRPELQERHDLTGRARRERAAAEVLLISGHHKIGAYLQPRRYLNGILEVTWSEHERLVEVRPIHRHDLHDP